MDHAKRALIDVSLPFSIANYIIWRRHVAAQVVTQMFVVSQSGKRRYNRRHGNLMVYGFG
jgi:hypothetical protein